MKLSDIQVDRANDYKFLYSRMITFARPYMLRGILGILVAIPVGLLDSAVPFGLKLFIDNILPKENMNLVYLLAAGIILVAIIQGMLRYLSTYLTDWSGRKTTNDVKIALYKKLASYESRFYDINSSGLIMARFNGDADTASAGLLVNFKTILTMACSTLALAGVLIFTSWKLAIVALTVLGLTALPVSFIKKKVRVVSHEFMKLGGDIVVTFNETFSGNKIINSYNLQNHMTERFTENVTRGFNLSMSLTKTVNWLSPAMYVIASAGLALVIIFSAILLFDGSLTIGKIASFITALVLIYKPIKTIGNTFAGMQQSFEAMNRVINLFDFDASIKDRENAVEIDDIHQGFELKNVCFEYEEGTPVLKNINLSVKKGETIALVGNSGGGKSTLVNLIPRFYDVSSGAIMIDGLDVKDIKLDSLRDKIGVIFQDNFLFTGTIKENILLGKPVASDKDIDKAVEESYLSEFVHSLELGLDTEIGERGTRLSGGQKQRLAIARALVKNAPIVIMDEATSALDNKSEAVVQKALDKLMENRTVFVIAHRLSTIQNADRIAVINEGEIVELGSHEELIKNNGPYKTLYDAQFKNKKQTV